jgi:hypothetical protein
MENDDHANDEFISHSAGDHPEFASWVLLRLHRQPGHLIGV